MKTTTFEGKNVTISMDDTLKKELVGMMVNPEEVYRLIESFAAKLLASKYTGEFYLENEDTNASLKLNLGWNDEETEASIKILEVNLKNVNTENTSNIPKGAKFDFNPPEAPTQQ